MRINFIDFLDNSYAKINFGNNLKIIPDLYYIGKIKNDYVLYSSLLNRVFLLDKEAKKLLDSQKVPEDKQKIFSRAKLFLSKDSSIFRSYCNPYTKFRYYSDLFILLTTDCNLKCKYCFAQGGDVKETIDFDFIKTALDYISERNKKSLKIYFHGGGEPSLEIGLIKKIIKYAEKKIDKLDFGIQINGVLPKTALVYLMKNNFQLSVSIDGPSYIQDKQRPLKGGGQSSPFVEKTIKFLTKNNYPFSVRSTISTFSVTKQKEIIRHFHKLDIKSVHFEPIFEAGRSLKPKDNFSKAPDLDLYIENYLEAKKIADELNIRLISAFLPVYRRSCAHCGASIPNMFLTPDGYISCCYEAYLGRMAPKELIYGRFDKKRKKLLFNQRRISYLQKRIVCNMQSCQNCFLKWNCAGGCHSKTIALTGDMFKVNLGRCNAKRKCSKEYLLYKVEKELYSIKIK